MYLLHYAPDNASLIVRLALLELGLPFETRLVDRAENHQNSAAYRAIAPTGLIPALQMGDQVMFETGAILLHLAESHDTPDGRRLFPQSGNNARGDGLKWLFFIATSVHADCRMHFYPARYAGAEPVPPTMTAATRARLSAHFDLLESAAISYPALFWCNGPSILALYICVIARWLPLYLPAQEPWFDLARWPALHDLAARSQTRPSALTAAQAEGLGTDIFTAPQHPTPPEGSAT